MRSTAVIVVAAGAGSRMGGPLPKPYLMLGDHPILIHSLQSFDRLELLQQKVLVVSDALKHWVEKEFLPQWKMKDWKVVAGGASRKESTAKGLEAISSSCDSVLVHDGVRPFVSRSVIQQLLEKAQQGKNCIVAVPAKDTVKKVLGNRIEKTLARESLWLAQTPQAFSAATLRRAYQKVNGTDFAATDEASLVENLGEPVEVILGDPRNIKITTPQDLKLAEALLTEWEDA